MMGKPPIERDDNSAYFFHDFGVSTWFNHLDGGFLNHPRMMMGGCLKIGYLYDDIYDVL